MCRLLLPLGLGEAVEAENVSLEEVEARARLPGVEGEVGQRDPIMKKLQVTPRFPIIMSVFGVERPCVDGVTVWCYSLCLLHQFLTFSPCLKRRVFEENAWCFQKPAA